MDTPDIKFGSYAFGENIDTFRIEEESRVNQVTVPRRHGALSDEAYKGPIAVTIGGLILEETHLLARAAASAIRGALNIGKQYLTLYDDRRILCQKSMFSSEYEEGDLRRLRWSALLISNDYAFESVDQVVSEKTITANLQEEVFANAGDVETKPVIRITAGASEIASGLRIDNLTTGKFLVVNMAIAATEWVEIDTDLLTMVDQAGVNQYASFQGDFFALAGGNNTLKWTGSYADSPKLKLTYRSKYSGA